eukprot:5775-Pelagococcus_subviridis.AAC.2
MPLPHDSTPTSLRMGDDPQQPARASRRAAGFHRADETFVGRATATETGRRGVDRRAAVRSDGGDVRRRGRGRRDVRGRGRSIRGLGRQKVPRRRGDDDDDEGEKGEEKEERLQGLQGLEEEEEEREEREEEVAIASRAVVVHVVVV